MILKLYVVHDDAVKAYKGLSAAETHGQAERDFKMAVNRPESGHLYHSPEHFSLYTIGELDTESGKLNALPAPQHIISAKQLATERASASVNQQ